MIHVGDERRACHSLRVAAALLLFLIGSILSSVEPAAAAPVGVGSAAPVRQEMPPWMSPDTAATLELGFDVLVPGYVPQPFAGEPAVTASEGFYSLYWVMPGTPPTFLQVTGEVGGTIPDYSKHDRNVQLVENAEVQGNPAYHDLTPIYDLVYWQVGSVVYTVESHNLGDDDSLALANGLLLLAPGSDSGGEDQGAANATLSAPPTVAAGEVATIDVAGGDGATLTADAGLFTGTGEAAIVVDGDSAVEWQAPETAEDLRVSFVLSDSESGEWLVTAATLVQATTESSGQSPTIACPESASSGDIAQLVLNGIGSVQVEATGGAFPAESPNVEFAPDAGGGSRLGGELDGDAVTLAWVAPAVTGERPIDILLFDPAGTALGSCRILVVGAEDAEAPAPANVAEAEPDNDAGQGVLAAVVPVSDGTDVDEGAAAQKEAEPTKTPRPKKKSKRQEEPVVAPEMRGLPTAVPTEEKVEEDDKEKEEQEQREEDDEEKEEEPTAKPTRTPKREEPDVEPTATIAPTSSEDGMVAAVIGPEGGTLESSIGVRIEIPEGALAAPSTVTIQPVAGSKLPVQEGIELIPDTGFDVTVAGEDGRAIERLEAPAQISIQVPEESARDGMQLYRVEGTQLLAMSGVQVEGRTISAEVDGFSRFAAGVPAAVASDGGRSVLPFVLAAIVALIAMILLITFGGAMRRRRPRAVGPRRPPRRPTYR